MKFKNQPPKLHKFSFDLANLLKQIYYAMQQPILKHPPYKSFTIKHFQTVFKYMLSVGSLNIEISSISEVSKYQYIVSIKCRFIVTGFCSNPVPLKFQPVPILQLSTISYKLLSSQSSDSSLKLSILKFWIEPWLGELITFSKLLNQGNQEGWNK